MKTLSEPPFPLSEVILMKRDLLKLPKTDYIIWLKILSGISLSSGFCNCNFIYLMLKVMTPMAMSLWRPNLLLRIRSEVKPMTMQKIVNTAMNAGPAKTCKQHQNKSSSFHFSFLPKFKQKTSLSSYYTVYSVLHQCK